MKSQLCVAVVGLAVLAASGASAQSAPVGPYVQINLGSAVAGFLIDDVGVTGAYAAAAGFALVGAIVAVVFVRGFLDLRGRDASPIPDIEPVQTIT